MQELNRVNVLPVLPALLILVFKMLAVLGVRIPPVPYHAELVHNLDQDGVVVHWAEKLKKLTLLSAEVLVQMNG